MSDMLAQIAADTAARIAEADTKAARADMAFAVGKFEEYFQAEYDAVEKAVQDEYERIVGPDAAGGNGETSG